jgi:hypothetical protein
MNKINWNENFKIRIASSDDSMMKHDIIKLMIVRKLINKNKKDKDFIRIYTEHEVMEGIICDIYFENIRKKEAFAYEVQKQVSERWKEDITNKYKDWNVYGMNSSDLIVVHIKELSDDINKINEELEVYIF